MGKTAGKKRPNAAKREEVVPKGVVFMPRVSLKRLTKAHKKEKAGKSKYRLHAALLRKEGKSIRKISRMLGVAYSTVRDWLVRMHAGNLKRRFDRKRRDRVRMILRQVHRNIKWWLGRDPTRYWYEAGSWQMVMIQDMLYKKFRIRCKTGTLRRALRRIRFSYRKPRPVPYNSATPEEQERFKVETNRLVNEAAKEGFAVLTCDEMHARLWSDAGYGWRPTNGHYTLKTSYSKKSVSVFGVLGFDSLHVRTVDACNSETFKVFLREMMRTHPRILLILDNAPCHRSETVTEFVKDNEDRLKPVFLPAYTPQLNPIEQQRNVLKRMMFAGRYFASVEGCHRGHRPPPPDAPRRDDELPGGRAITKMIQREGDWAPPVENPVENS